MSSFDFSPLASGGAQGLLGGLFSTIAARQNYKYQKRLMALQNQYDIAAFDREVAATRDLSKYNAVNSNKWLKTSLMNAGYSTADPNGTGVQTAGSTAPNMDVPAVPSFNSWDSLAGVAQTSMQSALIQAQIKKLSAETEGQLTENESMKLDLQKYRDTYQDQVNSVKTQYYMLTKQNRNLDAELDKLAAVTASIDIDTRFKQSTFDLNREKLVNEVSLLVKENKVKEISVKLADYGILLGESDIGTILSIAASDKGPEAAAMFGTFIGKVVGSIPRALGEMLKALWDEATK